MAKTSSIVRVSNAFMATFRLELKKRFQHRWCNPIDLGLFAYYLVMAVTGLLIPDDILQTQAWARSFSDFMASIVPQIDRITALGIKPDANRFYFSVLWATNPLLLGIFLTSFYVRWRLLPAVTQRPLHRIAGAFLTFVICLFLTWNVGFVDPSERLTQFLFRSDFGRSFHAQVVFAIGPVFCFVGMLIFPLSCVARLKQTWLSKPNHG